MPHVQYSISLAASQHKLKFKIILEIKIQKKQNITQWLNNKSQ